MRPYTVTYTPTNTDVDGFANDVTAAAGLPFALSATTVGDGIAHKIIITPSASVTGNYTISGTDSNGVAQSEVLATNTTSAVTSVLHYLTLTSVLSPAGIGVATVDIGWTNALNMPMYVIDWPSPYAANISMDITGVATFSIDQTFDNVLAGVTPSWTVITAFAAKTADTSGTAAVGATAFRPLVTSFTAGATLKLSTNQASR